MKTGELQINQFMAGMDKKKIARMIILVAIIFTVADTLYMNIMGIHQGNREKCIVYTSMPHWLFLTYEFFCEFFVVVLLGVFVSVLAEQYFLKIKRFFPKNQLLAFTYGAMLPICSCGAIPMIEVMKQRVSLKVIITFVIAAPLLNPYIVFLSFSVLGFTYGLLRIITSFVLAITSGIMVEFFVRRYNVETFPGSFEACQTDCSPYDRDPFVKTLRITKKLLPYILIGGILSITLEYFNPKQYLESLSFSNNWLSMLIMMGIGIPIYVCNGADVLLLKPLLAYTDLSLSAAMIFSLSSSVVCISSIVMLSKFLGKTVTIILISNIILITFVLGWLINLLPS